MCLVIKASVNITTQKKVTAHICCCRTEFCIDPDLIMKLPSCPLFPFKYKGEGGKKNKHCMQVIYLPVSSFEHHSKGSMTDQIFSTVLKISHCLHCDGLMVQLMLGTVVDSLECCSPL